MAKVNEAAPLFEVSQLYSNGKIKHEVQSAYLTDPDHANILTRIVTDDLHRYIAVYAAKDDHHYLREPVSILSIDDDVIFMDTGKVQSGKTQSLLLFKRNQVVIVDPLTGKQSELIRFSSLYMHPVAEVLPSLDLVKDINGDGLEDLMVPDFDGYWVYLQIEDGVFDQGRLIRIPAIMGVPSDWGLSYRPVKPYFADMNLDGLQDIVFWAQGEQKTFFQESMFNFSTTAESHKFSIELVDEGMVGITIGVGDAEDQSNVEVKSLYNLTDLNGDGFADVVTMSVLSAGVLNKNTRYEIYMGFDMDGKVGYSSTPESVIESDGIQFNMDEQDFNNDGAVDFAISSVEIGLGKILMALLTGSVSTDLSFYRMNDGRYQSRPNTTREVTATIDLSSGDVTYPAVLIADIDGDRIMDLIVQDGRKGLKIFKGELSEDLFAKQPTEFAVEMPSKSVLLGPDMFSVEDLNNDGKKDIIIRYEDRDNKLPYSMNVLMAR